MPSCAAAVLRVRDDRSGLSRVPVTPRRDARACRPGATLTVTAIRYTGAFPRRRGDAHRQAAGMALLSSLALGCTPDVDSADERAAPGLHRVRATPAAADALRARGAGPHRGLRCVPGDGRARRRPGGRRRRRGGRRLRPDGDRPAALRRVRGRVRREAGVLRGRVRRRLRRPARDLRKRAGGVLRRYPERPGALRRLRRGVRGRPGLLGRPVRSGLPGRHLVPARQVRSGLPCGPGALRGPLRGPGHGRGELRRVWPGLPGPRVLRRQRLRAARLRERLRPARAAEPGGAPRVLGGRGRLDGDGLPVDGDGNADAFVAGERDLEYVSEPKLAYLRGRGDGSFDPVTIDEVGSSLSNGRGGAVADLDDDGFSALVVTGGSVSVVRGGADGPQLPVRSTMPWPWSSGVRWPSAISTGTACPTSSSGPRSASACT